MTKALDRRALISEYADQQVNRMSRERLEQYAYEQLCIECEDKTDSELIEIVEEFDAKLLAEFRK